MEDSEQQREHSDWLRSKAVEIIETLLGDADAGTTPAFALPSVGSSTFTRLSTDRTLIERNYLLDESDGISSSDLDNG